MLSVWQDYSSVQSFSPLKGDAKTHVLIIGGGITGLLTAYLLHQKGVPYILLEKDKIAGGVTCNTTAKITYQHGLVYSKILKMYGSEKAQMYLNAGRAAFDKYVSLCQEIDCDFEFRDNYVYSVADSQKLWSELKALDSLRQEADFCLDLELPFKTAGAVRFKNQAQFNPLKFLSHISRNLNIYENTKVQQLVGTTALTDKGSVKADKIIVATHFPFINKHGSYFLKMYQHRSYVIALKKAEKVNGMYVDESKTGLSFRNYRDLLLIGGGDHRTGKKGGNWKELRDFAKRYYSRACEEYCWATQDCMSLDEIPYIGQYSKNTPNMFTATGFNKWGMTNSLTAAMILSDAVQGVKNECAEVFSPSRSMLKTQLLINGFEAVTNLLTPTTKRCPHLGCALKWNKAEHSWDCPCHGSRFAENGKVLENPANGDLRL